jgi:methyl coenzyme M reductase beta subunit
MGRRICQRSNRRGIYWWSGFGLWQDELIIIRHRQGFYIPSVCSVLIIDHLALEVVVAELLP